MPRAVTFKSLPEACAVIKEMQGQDYQWGAEYRAAGRAALAEILEGQMALRVDRHLEEMAARGTAERRNGAYSRWLLSELGRIELAVPRTRHFSPHPARAASARCADEPGPWASSPTGTQSIRILFAVFTYENQNQGVSAPFLLTQNS